MYALTYEDNSDEMDEDDLTPMGLLLEICVGLVIVNIEDDTVRMVHTSAYESFGARESAVTHEGMAKTCLVYLSSRFMATRPCQNIDDMTERFRQMSFLSYAARHWGARIKDKKVEQSLEVQIKKPFGERWATLELLPSTTVS
jgi:hypothetical protein